MKAWKIAAPVVVGCAALAAAAGEVVLRAALGARKDRLEERPFTPELWSHGDAEIEASYRTNAEAILRFRQEARQETAEIIGQDGVPLSGYLYYAEQNTGKWAVILHGYRGDHRDMEGIALEYVGRGYSVLLPDLRAHGTSGGKWVGMGWTDRMDLLCWLSYLIGRFGASIQIVLHGHSMGATTILMAEGETLPEQVRAAVSDCAYSDAWEELRWQVRAPEPMKSALHVPRMLLMLHGGYDLRRTSAVEQVKKSSTPTLYIHGEDDTFVPTRMVHELYAAAAGDKELLLVPGAGHIQSKEKAPALYYDSVFRFLARYVTEPTDAEQRNKAE